MLPKRYATLLLISTLIVLLVRDAHAQEVFELDEVEPLAARAGPARETLVHQPLTFDSGPLAAASDAEPPTVVWEFGDGTKATGEKVSHAYQRIGTYTVTLRLNTAEEVAEDTTEVRVYDRALILLADPSVPDDQLQLRRQQGSKAGLLVHSIRATSGATDVSAEDEIVQQLLSARQELDHSFLVVSWSTGGTGASILSKFSQHERLTTSSTTPATSWHAKGIVLVTDVPFGVMTPTAQSLFDQLGPAYVLLGRPAALELLFEAKTAEDARLALLTSPIEYRLLGAFSARTVRDLSITNFMSFGLSYLVNRGVPLNSIVLILMLPVIATILAFARQVIGVKAFGLVTPTMTTLSFLVMGLPYGLIAFAVVLLSGTLTRLVVRRWRLLYLPRMALVLSSVSVAMLLLLGIGSATDRAAVSSFSVFPILILIILAEEFIAVQFTSGARSALTITVWTLLLSILGYYLVSWELFRTFLLAYPEIILLTIPLNILIGRWGGLRVTEYFRFRQLLRYDGPHS